MSFFSPPQIPTSHKLDDVELLNEAFDFYEITTPQNPFTGPKKRKIDEKDPEIHIPKQRTHIEDLSYDTTSEILQRVGDIESVQNISNLLRKKEGEKESPFRGLFQYRGGGGLNKIYFRLRNIEIVEKLIEKDEFHFQAVRHLEINEYKAIEPVLHLITDHFTGLWSLSITRCDLINVPRLRTLKQLKDLDLSFNLIGDLIGLKGLMNLKRLDLGNNKLGNLNRQILRNNQRGRSTLDFITFDLGSLPKLSFLGLERCNLKEVAPLAKSLKGSNLQKLNLNGNKISDDELGQLVKLQSLVELKLQSNNLISLRHAKFPRGLKKLDLEGNLIDLNDTEPLKNLRELKKLEDLNLAGNRDCVDIKWLRPLTSLKKLDLSYLKSWFWGDVDDRPIRDIRPLWDLKNLEILYLKKFRLSVEDVKILGKMPNLKELNLEDNDITDISALKNLKNLKKLNISANYSLVVENLTLGFPAQRNVQNLRYYNMIKEEFKEKLHKMLPQVKEIIF